MKTPERSGTVSAESEENMGKTSATVKNRYNAKAYDKIILAVPKGEKEQYQKHAQQKSMSLTALIRELLKKDMNA